MRENATGLSHTLYSASVITNVMRRIEGGMGGLGRNKGILGFLGGAAMCIPFNYALLRAAVWSGPRPTTAVLLVASTLVGMAGAFADLAVPTPTLSVPKNAKVLGVKIPPFHIDDNFVVPIFTAFAVLRIFEIMALPGLKLGEGGVTQTKNAYIYTDSSLRSLPLRSSQPQRLFGEVVSRRKWGRGKGLHKRGEKDKLKIKTHKEFENQIHIISLRLVCQTPP